MCTWLTKVHQVVVLTHTLHTRQRLKDHQRIQEILTHVHHEQTILRLLNVAALVDPVAIHTKALSQPAVDQAATLTVLQDLDQREPVSILSVPKLDVYLNDDSILRPFEILNEMFGL